MKSNTYENDENFEQPGNREELPQLDLEKHLQKTYMNIQLIVKNCILSS